MNEEMKIQDELIKMQLLWNIVEHMEFGQRRRVVEWLLHKSNELPQELKALPLRSL